MGVTNFSTKNLKSLSFVKIDHIFISMVILSGFLVYFHNLTPDIKTWKTFFFTLTPAASYSVQTFSYVALIKLTPVLLFSIWYVCDGHWWRYAIAVPLGYLMYQMCTFLNNNLDWRVDNEVIHFLPIIIFALCLLTLIQFKLKYKYNNLGAIHKIDSENLHLIPSRRQNNKRINKIQNVLLLDNINRAQLNTIYKEYDFLRRVDSNLDRRIYDFTQSGVANRSISSLKWILELLIFIFIVSMPLIFAFYEISKPGEKVLEYGFFKITKHGFSDVRTFLWVLATKLIVVLPLTIWFFTNRYWWKYFLLIPFSIYSIQIVELFKTEDPIDGVELKMVIPLVALIVGVMMVFSLRIRKYLSLMEFYSVMESKINTTINEISIETSSKEKKQLKEELTKLIKEHKRYKPEEYLSRLKEIKSRLEALKDRP